MSLRNKVISAIDSAFNKIGDLAVNAVFNDKTVSGFDFATGTIVNTTSTVTKKVVLESSISQSEGVPTIITKLITQSTGEDFSVYTQVVVNNTTYNIIKVSDDGYIVTAIIAARGK